MTIVTQPVGNSKLPPRMERHVDAVPISAGRIGRLSVACIN